MDEYSIKKFLTEEQEAVIESLVTDANFPWFLSTGTVLPKDIADNPFIVPLGLNPPQFIHRININSCPFVDVIAPILNTLTTEFQKNISIVRIKFNLLMKGESDQFHFPHTDIDETENCYTAIYYVTESDGPTYLFNEFGPKSSDELTIKSVLHPEKGKMAIFRANRFHASSSPKESEFRIVLNIVYRTSIIKILQYQIKTET